MTQTSDPRARRSSRSGARGGVLVAVLVLVVGLAGFLALRGATAGSGSAPGGAPERAATGPGGGASPVAAVGTLAPVPPAGTVPPAGSYARPGQVGFRGSLADLAVVDATHLPGELAERCRWDPDEGIRCTGDVTFDHAYVKAGIFWDSDGTLTIRNSVVEGGTPNGVGKWTVRSFDHPGNTIRIEDSTLRWSLNPRSPTPSASVVTDGAQQMFRDDVSQGDSGFLPVHDGDTFVQNYIHDVRRVAGKSHNDGIFAEGGRDILIQQNYIDEGYDGSSQTAVLFWQGSGLSGHRVWGNYLSGGGFTYYNQSATGLDVRNNTFDDRSYDGSSADRHPLYGLTAQDGGSIAVWSGNVTTSGRAVPQP